MLTTARAKAAWSMQLDLRRVGLGVGWTLLAVSLAMFVILYALTLSHPSWEDTPALTLTSGLAAALLVSSVLVLSLSYAIKAVADSFESYQAAVRDIVAGLKQAIPPIEEAPDAEVYDIGSGRGQRRLHTMS